MEKKYVLIADDEPAIRAVLKEVVQTVSDGVMVLEAVDGADAIRKIKLQKFALVILDLRMPKFDGHAVLNGIRALPLEYKPERTLVVSAFSSREEIKAEYGEQVDYLAKPFQTDLLSTYLTAILKKGVQKPLNPSAQFDIKIVNAFIESTIQVLETMAQTPAVKDSLYIRTPDGPSGDISAILSLHSTKHKGSLAISFGQECFLGVVNRMLGESHQNINAENSDAAAELCNQIFGIAKKQLNAAGDDLQPAIPSVITGANHKIQHKTSGPCVVVKFRTDVGTFTIETVMEVKAAAGNVAA